MNIFEIAILGIVQGLTEFLPISSSAHLALLPKLLGWQDPGLDVDAFLHLGTLFAVLIYFWKDLLDLVVRRDKHKLLLAIIIATLPAIAIGFGFKNFFESDFVRSYTVIAVTLIAGSILMWAADYFHNCIYESGVQNDTSSKLQSCFLNDLLRTRFGLLKKSMVDLKLVMIFFIGCMQALALFPGVSRSGATISGALFMGLNRSDAAKFSFLLGAPAVAGAGLLAVKDMLENLLSNGVGASFMGTSWFDIVSVMNYWLPLGIGFTASFISGYFAIGFLIKFLQSRSLMSFIVYRMALALFILL